MTIHVRHVLYLSVNCLISFSSRPYLVRSSRPYLVRSHLCYSVASVVCPSSCLSSSSVRNVLWLNGAS